MSPAAPPTMSCEQVLDDPEIYVIRVPFVRFGLGWTNCYVVRDGDDALIIDQGAAAPLASRAFARIVKGLGIDLAQARFLCTHLHFDHATLLKPLSQPGSRILMDAAANHDNPWNYYDLREALLKSVLIEEGVPPLAMYGLAAAKMETHVCDLPDRMYVLLHDDDSVHVGAHELRVIETPGHATGHLCLYSAEQRILFAGDHVLEKITPGLSLPFEGDDSLRNYLTSLTKVENLDCVTVLPGHGEAFVGLAQRCAKLRSHHAARLAEVYELVARNPGLNGDSILRKMPWKRSGPIENWDQLNTIQRITMGAQVFSYLEYLTNLGEIVREEESSGRHYRLA